ncbi:rhodanese-like domain-containing protein [Methanobrevibacter sp. OttesenSCG-928-I08]|nr:rhodanese-like domain-containing protein [Methanobrevibacter sp. OttesenSCG-928-I08]
MSYKVISPEELKSDLENNKNLLLIDVRSKEEHYENNIPNSVVIPLDTIDENIESKLKDKNEKIFLYCLTGKRSKIAADILEKLGYTNIYVLDGGINNWNHESEKASVCSL